jgi:succinate dehydrogenase hydrophobic anchor subunit
MDSVSLFGLILAIFVTVIVMFTGQTGKKKTVNTTERPFGIVENMFYALHKELKTHHVPNGVKIIGGRMNPDKVKETLNILMKVFLLHAIKCTYSDISRRMQS